MYLEQSLNTHFFSRSMLEDFNLPTYLWLDGPHSVIVINIVQFNEN
jgi:hypothetical protein